MAVDLMCDDEEREWNLFNAYRNKAVKEFQETERLRDKVKEASSAGAQHIADEMALTYDRLVNITMMHIAMAELHRPRGN